MKKILIFLGGLILVIALAITGMTLFSRHQASEYADTAVPYIKTTIPELSKWDAKLIRSYMAPKALTKTTDENFDRIVAYFSKLGALVTFEEPSFTDLYTGDNLEVGQSIVTYTIDAVYENGDAEISIALLALSDSFQIYKFDIKSMALAQ